MCEISKKSCRSRQELSNEYLVANFGFDTAENEPFNFHNFSSLQGFNFHRGVVSEVDRLTLENAMLAEAAVQNRLASVQLPYRDQEVTSRAAGGERLSEVGKRKSSPTGEYGSSEELLHVRNRGCIAQDRGCIARNRGCN